MSVQILFASGSKRWSHNLDDTRERWELRHELNAREIIEESRGGYAIPRIDDTDDYDALMQIRDVYKQMLAALQLRMALLRPNAKGANRSQWLHLVGAADIVNAELARVGDHLKRINIQRSETKDHMDLVTLRNYTRQLERIVLDEHLPLPPKPFETWLNDDELQVHRSAKKAVKP